MGLEVYYPEDIRNALLAAEQASGTALQVVGGEGNELARGYREGYQAALTTIAIAFGLVQPYGRIENHGLEATFLSATIGLNPNVLPRPPPFSRRINLNGA